MDEEDDIRRFLVRGTGSQLAANKSLKDMLDDIEGSGFSTATDSLKILSDVLDLIRTELTFQQQADAALTQASPEQNKWYTVLDTTANVRLYSVNLAVEDTAETLAVRITIDGRTLTGTQAATAGTWYYAYSLVSSAEALSYTSSIVMAMYYAPLEGRSVKVEVRKTTANGTGNLLCRVKYAKR